MTDAMHDDPATHDLKIVRLSNRDLEDVRRLLTLLNDELPESAGAQSRSNLESKAREILAARRRRAERFGRAMFKDHGWEMLLLLYTLESGARQTVNRIAELSGATRSTAMRWLNYLEQQQLVRRDPHPTDKRRAFVSLTESGRTNLELYLSETSAPEG